MVDVTSGDLAVSWADGGRGVGTFRGRIPQNAPENRENAQSPAAGSRRREGQSGTAGTAAGGVVRRGSERPVDE